MICRRTSAISLLVVALIFPSLLTPHLPTAGARHVVSLKDIRREHVAGDDAGKVVPDPVVVNAGGSRPPRTVEARGATKHQRDAAAKMSTMLHRDYSYHASRRKPIHNDEPLEDEP